MLGSKQQVDGEVHILGPEHGDHERFNVLLSPMYSAMIRYRVGLNVGVRLFGDMAATFDRSLLRQAHASTRARVTTSEDI